MKNWKVWTAFLTVFATGVIVGVVGVGLVMQQHFGKPKDFRQFRNTMQERLLADIMDNVRPDDSAIPAIKAALNETLDELDAIRAETHPRLKAVLDKGRERITMHLTPEQIRRFDRMAQDRRDGKFGFLRLPPPPPMPPMP